MTQTSYCEDESYQYLETLAEELQQVYTEMNKQLEELKEQSYELFESRVTNLLEQGRIVAEELETAKLSSNNVNCDIIQVNKIVKELKGL
ncbi:hypothetical protein SteCoe_9375 [Stentor coeruleus]|uniref:Uncharacterized protein n=1 Tax=Stentor coeruleus TaxID=5963 RepID=A0A1R2CI46_9CILI|nr:hypothetical protein SteCoe_9375 [Stentor coeruleus]